MFGVKSSRDYVLRIFEMFENEWTALIKEVILEHEFYDVHSTIDYDTERLYTLIALRKGGKISCLDMEGKVLHTRTLDSITPSCNGKIETDGWNFYFYWDAVSMVITKESVKYWDICRNSCCLPTTMLLYRNYLYILLYDPELKEKHIQVRNLLGKVQRQWKVTCLCDHGILFSIKIVGARHDHTLHLFCSSCLLWLIYE